MTAKTPSPLRVESIGHHRQADEFAGRLAGECRQGRLALDFTDTWYWHETYYANLLAGVRTLPLRALQLSGMCFTYQTQEADDNMRDMMDYHYVQHDADVLSRVLEGARASGLPTGLEVLDVRGGHWLPADGEALAAVLPESLTHLAIRDAAQAHHALAALADRAMPHWTRLTIGGTDAGDELAKAIAQLFQARRLQHLCLDAPQLTARGVTALRDAPGLRGRLDLRVVAGANVRPEVAELLAQQFPITSKAPPPADGDVGA